MISQIAIESNVTIVVIDHSLGLKTKQRVRNKLLADGRDIVRDLLGNAGLAPGYIALGQNATEVTDADEALGSEVFRNAFTRIQAAPSRIIYQLHVLSTQANGYTIQEIGLFTGTRYGYSTDVGGYPLYGGTLVSRALIGAVAKTAAKEMTISWTLNIKSE